MSVRTEKAYVQWTERLQRFYQRIRERQTDRRRRPSANGDSAGYVDYFKAIRRTERAGVTVQNNAVTDADSQHESLDDGRRSRAPTDLRDAR